MKQLSVPFRAIIVLITLSFHGLNAQPYHHSVGIHVPVQPSVFNVQDVPSCYYELYVTSFYTDTISIDKVEIRSKNIDVLTIGGSELQSRCVLAGFPRGRNGHILRPGGTTIIYIEIHSPLLTTAQELTHTLSVKTVSKSITTRVVEGFSVRMTNRAPLVVGPSLRGGPWAAVYDPRWQTGHRRMIYTINGIARIPGRYAIDFILLNNEGHYANGDDNIISNWFGYGQDVLAVADAEVCSVIDTFPEASTISSHPDYTAEKATGNYISLKVNDSAYVFYEHLKPYSIRVRPGQKVKKGEVIGSLGFTGQSTGPHLHFHVADRDSPLGAESIPFSFEQFNAIGSYVEFEQFGKNKWTVQNGDQTHSRERPQSNAVIVFP